MNEIQEKLIKEFAIKLDEYFNNIRQHYLFALLNPEE